MKQSVSLSLKKYRLQNTDNVRAESVLSLSKESGTRIQHHGIDK
jgi:hypothetical protein